MVPAVLEVPEVIKQIVQNKNSCSIFLQNINSPVSLFHHLDLAIPEVKKGFKPKSDTVACLRELQRLSKIISRL